MAVSTLTKSDVHTAEDLERLSAQGDHYELIKGELREMAPPGGTHGSSTSRLSIFVGALVIDKDLGETFAAETGFLVSRHPDTIIAPDFAFVSKSRLPTPLPKSYVPVVPDIVLETRSPNDTKKEVADKVSLWLELGVRLVWELNPQTRMLTVYRPHQIPRFLGEGDILDGEDVLPGFSVPISRLFPSII
ncbi:MAG: Uma2 family endonuclease [Janthinobacterium lividum]